eukprot:gene34474-57248_t
MAERGVASGALTDAETSLYTSMKARHGGMGIAQLERHTCTGCHVDLSQVEYEQVVHTPAGELPDRRRPADRETAHVLLWFVATSVLTIFFVFRDPRFDYRWLIAGALLPDVVDVWFGGARVLHSLTGAVGAMVLVMLVTAGRRPIRRRLLSLPIGVLLHLVFDGAFSATEVFWWPFMGGFDDASLPVAQRGWWNLGLELAG